MDLLKVLSPKKEPPRKAAVYDQGIENIDPHVKTKVLDAQEIVLGGVRRTTWPSGGSGAMATDVLWDAVGDLACGTGADAGARLAAGTSGQVLVTKGTGASPAWENQTGGTTDHAALSNLAYATAAHTGFEPAKGADDNFVTDAQLALIAAITSSAAELNLVDGSVADTIVNSKAVVYSAAGRVNATTLAIGGTSITSSAAELNAIDGYTGTAANLNTAVSQMHAANADTAVGTGCVALDHGTAATDMLVNVCYGTGAAPTASTTTEGTIYLTYTA